MNELQRPIVELHKYYDHLASYPFIERPGLVHTVEEFADREIQSLTASGNAEILRSLDNTYGLKHKKLPVPLLLYAARGAINHLGEPLTLDDICTSIHIAHTPGRTAENTVQSRGAHRQNTAYWLLAGLLDKCSLEIASDVEDILEDKLKRLPCADESPLLAMMREHLIQGDERKILSFHSTTGRYRANPSFCGPIPRELLSVYMTHLRKS